MVVAADNLYTEFAAGYRSVSDRGYLNVVIIVTRLGLTSVH